MKDPYQTLGVKKSASPAEIKKTYRKLAKKLHPDRNPDDDKVANRFKQISAAYSILGDKKQRAKFDRLYAFHCLRHTSVTNVYRTTRDLFLAQRFARHASPLTTTVYTHPSDEELQQRISSLGC